MVLTVSFVLSLMSRLVATIPGAMRSIVTKLTPASGRQDHTSIFWHSVKHAEAKKTLQNKRFWTSLMQDVSAGFAKCRARP
jgi:hypothetical protein